MKNLSFAAFAALSLSSCAAMAQTCPVPSSITQVAWGDGYAYSASGGWVGEHPMADEEDLATFQFTSAKLTDELVICRYEGQPKGGASLSVRASKEPVGNGWNAANECAANDVAGCAFK